MTKKEMRKNIIVFLMEHNIEFDKKDSSKRLYALCSDWAKENDLNEFDIPFDEIKIDEPIVEPEP